MPQFVLIDHSVQDTTGHHYEYAMRVLEAARNAGYTPVLGANLNFAPKEPPAFPVCPVYPVGFWPRMARARGAAWTVRAIKWGMEFGRRLRYRLFFSRLGFIWLIRNEPFGYLRWHPFDSPVESAMLVLIGAPALALRLVAGLLRALVPFQRYFREVLSSIWSPLRFLVARMVDFVAPNGSMAEWRFAKLKQKSFGDATLRLLRTLELSSDDLVFIPTLAEPEMLGLISCFARLPAASLPSYHLLFRRNLYQGRDPDFDAQESAILPIRNAFLRFKFALSQQRVFFYTDTDELSRQFNRLKIFPFRTCPIPHTVPAAECTPSTNPLKITYLGDARVEKGYHHLPAVIQDLWCSDVREGKVSFVIQSNYNVEPGEAEAIVARSQLISKAGDSLRLILETCTSAEYRRTLLSASVMVLPYQADAYSARSSGVLIEALAAGIPVVVPATSWLAKQIADPAYAYLEHLHEHANPARHGRRSWICEGTQDGLVMHDPRTLSFGGESRKAYTWLSLPPGVDAMVIAARFERLDGTFVTCYVDQVDEQGQRVDYTKQMIGPGYTEGTARLAIRIHKKTRRAWVAFRNAFSDSMFTLHDVSVRFLSAMPEKPVPLSAVGVSFSEETPQAISRALQEVLAHYDHYRMTAVQHSQSVYRFHNAANLIHVLASADTPEIVASISRCAVQV